MLIQTIFFQCVSVLQCDIILCVFVGWKLQVAQEVIFFKTARLRNQLSDAPCSHPITWVVHNICHQQKNCSELLGVEQNFEAHFKDNLTHLGLCFIMYVVSTFIILNKASA